MEKNLEEELNARYQYGKTKLVFKDPMEAATHGETIINEYFKHPMENLGVSELRIVSINKVNLVPLAKVILELKGWLRINTEKSTRRDIVEQRVISLLTFMHFQMKNIEVIARLPVMNMFVSDDIIQLNSAIKSANEILTVCKEVTTFVAQR